MVIPVQPHLKSRAYPCSARDTHGAHIADKPCITAYDGNESEGRLCSQFAATHALSSFFLPSLPLLFSSCFHTRPSQPYSPRLLHGGDHSRLPLVSKALLLGFDARSAHIRRCSSDAMPSSPKWDPHLATLLCPSYLPLQPLANTLAMTLQVSPRQGTVATIYRV